MTYYLELGAHNIDLVAEALNRDVGEYPGEGVDPLSLELADVVRRLVALQDRDADPDHDTIIEGHPLGSYIEPPRPREGKTRATDTYDVPLSIDDLEQLYSVMEDWLTIKRANWPRGSEGRDMKQWEDIAEVSDLHDRFYNLAERWSTWLEESDVPSEGEPS